MAEKPLKDKIAWVTGSSRGIGREIAAHLADLGASMAVHGTSLYSTRAFGEADSLNAVAETIAQQHDVEVLPVCGDLTDEAIVENAVSAIVERFGRVDILVNCAGGDIGAQGVTGPNAGKAAGNGRIGS